MMLIEKLKKEFGFENFRQGQREIIGLFEAGKNVLGILPTGLGKSLCFQWPAKTGSNLVLVITPLIALMQDQAQRAQSLNIQADYINSLLSADERNKRYKNLEEKKYKLLFVAPERFRNDAFLQALLKNQVDLFVVDEAHCISAWGAEFRPDYGILKQLIDKIKPKQIMALTATATPQVQKDIIQKLGGNFELVLSSPVRKNLAYKVEEDLEDEEKITKAIELLKTQKGTQIVYFSLIQSLYKFSQSLEKQKVSHILYHGDLPSHEKKKKMKIFNTQEELIVLATPAFGLGIDKPNIRQIIHFETPGSLEAYVQESGRAGRDGKEAQCVFLYSQEDLLKQMEFIKWATPDLSFLKTLFALIENKLAKVQQEGIIVLKENMTFKNNHDYRVETSIQLFYQWGLIDVADNKFGYELKNKWQDQYFFDFQREKRDQTLNQLLYKIVEYTKTKECRQKFIGNYFGFQDTVDCGICDQCLG